MTIQEAFLVVYAIAEANALDTICCDREEFAEEALKQREALNMVRDFLTGKGENPCETSV